MNETYNEHPHNKRSHTSFRRIGCHALLAVLGVTLASTAASHLALHRSLRASITECALRATRTTTTYEERRTALAARAASEETSYRIPGSVSFDEEFASQTYNGLTTYYLNSSNHSNVSILYLHGGGYTGEFSTWQWRFLNALANEGDVEIAAPDYPLAPWHTYEETYELLYEWWVPWQYGNSSRYLVIMGDSAGGGLALGFTEYLKEMGAALPENVILLSPWADLTMSNSEIVAYKDIDPMLDADMLLADAEAWAGDTDLTDYRLSPLYGDLTGLPQVTILAGTREILYPDARTLYERLLDAGNDCTLITGIGMNHDYPLLPIPEADTAIQQIIESIPWLTDSDND